jgi:hypothetical protein
VTLSSKRLAGPGRPAGSVNRATAEVRQAFSSLVEGNQSRLQEWLDRVADDNPRSAIDLYWRLVELGLRKLQRIDMSGSSSGEPIVVKIVCFSVALDADDKVSSAAS